MRFPVDLILNMFIYLFLFFVVIAMNRSEKNQFKVSIQSIWMFMQNIFHKPFKNCELSDNTLESKVAHWKQKLFFPLTLFLRRSLFSVCEWININMLIYALRSTIMIMTTTHSPYSSKWKRISFLKVAAGNSF